MPRPACCTATSLEAKFPQASTSLNTAGKSTHIFKRSCNFLHQQAKATRLSGYFHSSEPGVSPILYQADLETGKTGTTIFAMGSICSLGIDPLSTPGKNREVPSAERLRRCVFPLRLWASNV